MTPPNILKLRRIRKHAQAANRVHSAGRFPSIRSAAAGIEHLSWWLFAGVSLGWPPLLP